MIFNSASEVHIASCTLNFSKLFWLGTVLKKHKKIMDIEKQLLWGTDDLSKMKPSIVEDDSFKRAPG